MRQLGAASSESRVLARIAPIAFASLMLLALIGTTAVPAAGAQPWRATGAEDVAIRLTNCIRTGGHVTRAGTCRGWGSGRYSKAVPPLKRSSRISSKVTWPWARRSVTFYGARRCWIGHDRNGSTVDRRFASANFKRTIANGENMGCAMYGDGKRTVVTIVRLWQAEKKWGGPHWSQIKAAKFKSLGIGVARYGRSKAQIVLNFYAKSIP